MDGIRVDQPTPQPGSTGTSSVLAFHCPRSVANNDENHVPHRVRGPPRSWTIPAIWKGGLYYQVPRCDPWGLAYLSTKLGSLGGFHVGRYIIYWASGMCHLNLELGFLRFSETFKHKNESCIRIPFSWRYNNNLNRHPQTPVVFKWNLFGTWLWWR